MNKKQLEMIRFLSIHNRPMSGKELANALKVTPRSIKNYVHEINGLYGLSLIHIFRFDEEDSISIGRDGRTTCCMYVLA